jgi:hypothetical protein
MKSNFRKLNILLANLIQIRFLNSCDFVKDVLYIRTDVVFEMNDGKKKTSRRRNLLYN